MKEKLKNAYLFMHKWTVRLIFTVIVCLVGYIGFNTVSKNFDLPSFSWWSATLLSDNKIDSIITEVESSGYNMRIVQYIDVFGKLCTNAYVQGGQSGMDCIRPDEDKKNWTIEDYRKSLKDKK
jgi:hypothetical protein